MVAIATKKKPKIRQIPSYLVYEELGGCALPYKGYLDVLSGKKTPEEIMGSSSLQAVIVSILNWFIVSHANRKKYIVASNESGLHFGVGSNVANDIAIYERSQVTLNDKYFEVAPKVVVEVDIKVDLSETVWNNDLEYVLAKSQKMIDFGVEKIVWILTKSQKMFVITPNSRWFLTDFNEEVLLIDGCVLNLAQLLKDEDINIESKN